MKKAEKTRKDTTKRQLSMKKADATRKDTRKRKLSRQQAEKTRKDTPKRKLSRQQADSPRGETCVQLMKQILSDRLATVEGIDSLLGELPPVDDFLRHNFIRDLILEDWFNILARCRRLRPEILRLCINRLRMFIRKETEATRKDTRKRKLSRQQAEKTRKDTPKRKLSRQQADSPRGETCVQLMKQILSDRLTTVEGIDRLLGELPPVDDFLRHNFIRDLYLEDWFNILARCRRLRPEILRLCINRLRMFIRLPKFMTQTHL